jgi:hypothetical protein
MWKTKLISFSVTAQSYLKKMCFLMVNHIEKKMNEKKNRVWYALEKQGTSMELFQPEEQRRLYISCAVYNLWRSLTYVCNVTWSEVDEWLGERCKECASKGIYGLVRLCYRIRIRWSVVCSISTADIWRACVEDLSVVFWGSLTTWILFSAKR